MTKPINRRRALLTLAGACSSVMLPQAGKAAPTGAVLTGRIKWFDSRYGYGFIVPDDGGGEPLVTVQTLRAYGAQVAHEGARIHGRFEQRPKGRIMTAVGYLDQTGPTTPSWLPPRHPAVDITPDTDWAPALSKWYNRFRGFGFLTQGDGTPDIFVHADTIRRHSFVGLRPGQVVLVQSGLSPLKGRVAVNLKPIFNPERYLRSIAT